MDATEMFHPNLKNGKIPVQIQGHDIIESPKGLFIPTEIERFIKFKGSLDECKIIFVREMTKEECDAEKVSLISSILPPKISSNVQSEIDYLIGATERGDLRVNVDPTSEKEDDEFGGLFTKPDNWND
jgi:hypothetical protein